MAHISGFTGAIAFGGASSDTNFNPAASSLTVQSWGLTQNTDTHEAYAKNESWATTFYAGSSWTGTATFLAEDALAANNMDFEIRAAGEVGKAFTSIQFEFVSGADYFTGSGIVTGMTMDNPLDGPVTVTVNFTGDGSLTATVG